MKKRTVKIAALTSLSTFGMVGAFAATIAWFMTAIKINQINGTGYTDAAYFAYGTGTAEDPFGISEVRHLNNLAWLQYNGNFDNGHFYFELANDINVDGDEYVIPPIGTESHPFIGVFDGQGYTINNIKVTNDSSEYSKKPHNITYTQSDAEVVGFFGVVGELEDEPYASAVNSLHDVTLENLTVESKTANTLIGLAAGYINADMSGVKVGTSTIKTQGQAAKTAYTANLSDYGLVGYTTKTGSSGTFEQRLSQYYNSKSDGDDPGWGGSIAIKDLYTRLDTMRTSYSYSDSNGDTGLAYTDTHAPDGSVSRAKTKSIGEALYLYNEDNTRNGVTYNSQIGALQTNYGTSGTGGIYYLSGGHYLTDKYGTYNSHTGYKICDREGHYFSVGEFTSNTDANAGTFTTTDEAHATVWNVPTNNSGYISTTYRYNNGNQVTYYLYVYNNTTLRLSATTGSRTSFTRTVSDGYIRYSAGNYYLAYTAGDWTMTPIPTAPNPTTYNSYFADSYQIFYGSNYMSRSSNSATGVATGLTSTNTYGWKFMTTGNNGTDVSLENAIGRSVYIYTKNGNTNYYCYDNSTQPWGVLLTNRKNSASTYTISRYGDGYRIAISSYLVVYDSQNNIFSSRSASSIDNYGELYPTVSIETTQSLLANYQTAAANTYNINPTTQTTVDGPDMYIDDAQTTTGMDYSEQDVTYLPITTNGTNDLTAKDTNTGYIVGGSTYDSATSDYDYANVRIASFYTISDNLTNYNRTSKKFNDDSVWTRDASGLHQIDDDNNNFVKYLESKGKVEQTLSSGNNIYGLHFMSAAINKNHLVNARYAMINGEEYTNYEMPANAIDFNLKEQGYINFFAGAYGNKGNSATTIDSFFSLHMIKREGTSIDDIYEIEEVYSDGIPYHSYIYRFSNGMYSVPYSIDKYNPKKIYILNTKTPLDDVEHGGYVDGAYHQIDQSTFNTNYSSFSSVFNMAWLKNYSYASGQNGFHQGFYYEIPTNPGEYALGTVANKTFGAYLMYLDIAANASNKDQITAYAITTFQSGLKYPAGVDFNTTDVVGDNGGETLAIIILAGSSSDGDIDFTVSGTTIGYAGDFETQYAYSEKPASGTSPPAAATLPPSTGTRVIYTHILTTDYLEWDIQVTDLLDENGDATSSSITSVRCGGEPVTADDIPESFVINSIRPQVNSYIATFTRLSGENEFSMIPTYGGDDYKTVNISIDMNNTTLEVSNIASGYSISLNGTPVSNNSTYPSRQSILFVLVNKYKDNSHMKTIYLAGGCFWGVEHFFSLAKGIINTEVGYANGTLDNPRYEDLKHGLDDASETVKVDYDENVISLEKILELYLRVVDPYSVNKQGEDEGVQYRTGIYYQNDIDKDIIKKYFASVLTNDYKIEVVKLNKFFPAEEYHQDYLNKNPQGYCHIDMAKLKPEERK